MPIPFPLRQTATSSWSDNADIRSTTSNSQWRCKRCDKLLGVCMDGQMHLRLGRAHEYLVGYPVVATCRGCGTLNHATAPTPR